MILKSASVKLAWCFIFIVSGNPPVTGHKRIEPELKKKIEPNYNKVYHTHKWIAHDLSGTVSTISNSGLHPSQLRQFQWLHKWLLYLIIHKRRLYTWTSPDGQYQNQIDYILYSQKMEKLYTVSKNKTRSWLWLRSWTPYCQIQT